MRLLAPFAILSAVLLSSCASYQLGNPTSLPYSAIEVAPARNLSAFPQIEAPLNAALRQSVASDPALSLALPGEADAILELTVLELDRQIAAVTADDVGRGRKFELTFSLALSLRRPGDQDAFFIRDRRFSVTQDVFTDSGQVNAEYQASSEVARKISQRAVEILSDRW